MTPSAAALPAPARLRAHTERRPWQRRPDNIARAPTGVTAFVGRTLKGPLNRATPRIASFGEFQQTLRRPVAALDASPTPSSSSSRTAAAHAIVVRVANGARAPDPHAARGRRGALRLQRHQSRHARVPARLGRLRRHRRAGAEKRFNLVVQRVRA
jgi:hypothetical protein